MQKSLLKISNGWEKINENYSLKNDQGFSFVENYKSPCGQVVSLFLVDDGISIYSVDKMIKDYKDTTLNLRLLIKSQIIKKQKYDIYFIREYKSKKVLTNLFFESHNKLFCFMFFIDKFMPSTKKILETNVVINEIISLLEAQ